MNIVRQYKLYRLGVDIPPTTLNAIRFTENVIRNLTLDKDSSYFPQSEFYVSTNENNKVYMAYLKYDYLYCILEGFWEVLEKEHLLNITEIQTLIRMVVGQYLNIDINGLIPIGVSVIIHKITYTDEHN